MAVDPQMVSPPQVVSAPPQVASGCQSHHPDAVEPAQGPFWDMDGKKIEAHGAGLLLDQRSSRVYWYGESKKLKDFTTHAINVYV